MLFEWMCFTVISTLNLVQSATGTTDRAGCNSRFNRHLQLVISCPPSPVVRCMYFPLVCVARQSLPLVALVVIACLCFHYLYFPVCVSMCGFTVGAAIVFQP